MPGGTIVHDGPPPSPPPAPPLERPSGGGPQPTAAANDDLWPRTNRWLPWLIALFLAMLWLVPIDSITARFSFPVDPKLDRIFLSVIALVWLAGIFAGGRAAPRWRPGPLDGLVILFAGIALLSIVVNALVLARLVELDPAIRKIGLLMSYVTFFFIVATSLRPRELSRFAVLFTVLACVTAVGTLWEYETQYNPFFTWWSAVLPGAAFEINPENLGNEFVGNPVLGPARHGLALAGMFGMALSFAIVGLAQSPSLRRKVLYGIAFALILGGVFATSRKTGSFAAAGALIGLLALRPRSILRLAPFAFAALVAITLIAPRAVEYQVKQVDPATVTDGASSEGRSSDYQAIVPDVRDNLVVGRGFGSYDAAKYRILDNNYLGLLLETGLVGLLVFGAVILAVPASARKAARSSDRARWGPALAAGGGAAAFGVAMALFDALAFVQVPYMFFFMAAIAAVSRAGEEEWAPPAVAATASLPVARPERPAARGEAARRRIGPAPLRPPGEHAGERMRRPGTTPRRPDPVPGRTDAPVPPRVRPPVPVGAPHAGRSRVGAIVRARRRGAALLTLLAIGIGLSAMGRGPTQAVDGVLGLGQGGSGGDPFAGAPTAPADDDRSTQAPPPADRDSAGAEPRRAGDDAVLASTPATGTTTGPDGDADAGGNRPAPEDKPPDKPERPDRPEKPEKPEPDAPEPPAPPEVVAADCLPGDLEEDLVAAGIDPCAGGPTVTQLQSQILSAARRGRISPARAERLLRQLTAAGPGASSGHAEDGLAQTLESLDELTAS